VFKA
jgi:hypothetical protein